MNVHFARWMARRAASGDRVDVMVHEPFVDYFGGSWIQPARALVQRYMTRTVLRAARRVWMSIPGWEARLLPMVRDASCCGAAGARNHPRRSIDGSGRRGPPSRARFREPAGRLLRRRWAVRRGGAPGGGR